MEAAVNDSNDDDDASANKLQNKFSFIHTQSIALSLSPSVTYTRTLVHRLTAASKIFPQQQQIRHKVLRQAGKKKRKH